MYCIRCEFHGRVSDAHTDDYTMAVMICEAMDVYYGGRAKCQIWQGTTLMRG
jgi:hypothetical protein